MKLLSEILKTNKLPYLPYKEDSLEFEKLGTFSSDHLHHQELHKHYKNIKYSDGESMSINSYTGAGYRDINGHLWDEHHGIKSSGDFKVKQHVNNMDTAMDKTSVPRDMHVWSGINYDPREHMNSEGIVHHPGYMSTSTRNGTAFSFSKSKNEKSLDKHVMKIKVPKGHKGIYIPGSQGHMYERELILPRGMNLKHIKTKTIESDNKGARPWELSDMDHHDKKYTFHIHHMEVVK